MHSRSSVTDKIAPFVRATARSRFPVSDVTPPRGTLPFVTITRLAGAGGSTVAHALADALNERESELHWETFDRELVEMVAENHDISTPLVEKLENKSRNWLNRLLVSGTESEFGVYRRVAETIRALSEAGGAIVVGRGGVFITRDLPAGIHIRLVAPREYRVRHLVETRGWSEEKAEEFVRETDLGRMKFYKSRWPDKNLEAEVFHATFNTALVGTPSIVKAMLAIVPRVSSGKR